jgi:hypothetical protein
VLGPPAHRGWCLVQAPRWGWGVSRFPCKGWCGSPVRGSQIGPISPTCYLHYVLPAHCTPAPAPAQPAARTAPKKGGGAVISTLLMLMFYLDLQVRVRARGLVSQLVLRDVCASGHGHPGLWLITNKVRTTPPPPALCVCLLPSASAFCVICRLACSPWCMSHVIT